MSNLKLNGSFVGLVATLTVEVYESFRVGAAPGIFRTGVLLAQSGCDGGSEDKERKTQRGDFIQRMT